MEQVGKVFLKSVGCSQLLPAVRTWQVDVFPCVPGREGEGIKERERKFVQESVIYQFVLREMPATCFQVCES